LFETGPRARFRSTCVFALLREPEASSSRFFYGVAIVAGDLDSTRVVRGFPSARPENGGLQRAEQLARAVQNPFQADSSGLPPPGALAPRRLFTSDLVEGAEQTLRPAQFSAGPLWICSRAVKTSSPTSIRRDGPAGATVGLLGVRCAISTASPTGEARLSKISTVVPARQARQPLPQLQKTPFFFFRWSFRGSKGVVGGSFQETVPPRT